MSLVAAVNFITTVSGSNIVTIASGAAILESIIPSPISGGNQSYSGQVIRVNDAVSGMAAVASGRRLLYNWDFGNHSGLSEGTIGDMVPTIPQTELSCTSGIVVQGATGWYVTIAFSK